MIPVAMVIVQRSRIDTYKTLPLEVGGKNYKPILAEIIGYYGANWALNIICIFTTKYPNKSMGNTGQ